MKNHSVRIERILLENYLPLYASTGLDKIEIDRRTSVNTLTIIVGANGSGKTFLLTEITPDVNESVSNRKNGFSKIIPGRNGKKELDINVDNMYRYRCVIHYPDKTATKCFIEKEIIESGKKEELNPNGNVSSYMEVLNNEIDFNSSYINVSYISDGVMNIIGMTVSERNKYISSWLPAITEYLDAHKTVSKNYNLLKRQVNILNSDIAKLTTTDFQQDLNNVNASINTVEKELETVTHNLAKAEAYMGMLDSSSIHSIRTKVNEVRDNARTLHTTHSEIITSYEQFKQYSGEKGKEKLAQEISELSTNINHWETEVRNFDRSIIDLRVAIQEAEQKTKSFSGVENVNLIDITEMLKSLTTEQNTLRNIREKYIDSFPFYESALCDEKDVYQAFNMIDEIRRITKKIFEVLSLEEIRNKSYLVRSETAEKHIAILRETIKSNTSEMEALAKRIYILQNNGLDPNILSKKRDECTPDYCPLVKEIMTYLSPTRELAQLEAQLSKLVSENHKLEEQIAEEVDSIAQIRSVIIQLEEVDQVLYRHRDFIGRLPQNVVERLSQSSEFIISELDSIDALMKSYQEYSSVNENLKTISLQIERVAQTEQIVRMQENLDKETQLKMNVYAAQLENRRGLIDKITQGVTRLNSLKELYSNATTMKDTVQRYNSSAIMHEESRREATRLATHWYYRSHLQDIIYDLREKKNIGKSELESLQSRKENIQGRIATKDLFEKKRDEYLKSMKKYELLESIWSPSSGYPALLIEDFLTEVKEKANKDLKAMWGESLLIQDFKISEGEFSIPIVREGNFLVDDASFCSDGERSTLALAISLAIVEIHSQRSVYNVIRLDEADAKLDDLRRRSYLSMVVDRMEEIGISDCFAVTHNNEFDNVAADIILLSGADQSINSLQNKNVIFSV